MSAVAAVFVSLVVILVITAVFTLLRINASPRQRYRRELRHIRRLRKGIRPGDPNATTIGVNSDARAGYNY